MNQLTKNKYNVFLRKNGLKPTSQRNIVAKLLFNGKNKHFTAEDLYEKVKLTRKNISLATVYNTLHSFVEKKILKQVSIKEGKTIFCTNMKNHFHFFNSFTGKLSDFSSDEIQINKLPAPPKGMKIESIDVVINLNKKN